MTIPPLIATAFLVYLAVLAFVIAAILVRFLPARGAAVGLAVLIAWYLYDEVLGRTGIVAGPIFGIPGMAVMVAPVFLFIAVVLVMSPVGRYVATRIPLALLIGLQTFRVGVELTVHNLWEVGAMPRMLTLPGGSVELLFGLSAPAIAWISLKGDGGRRIAVGWAVLGLLSLINVAVRGVLSSPGIPNLLHAEVPNIATGMYPFSFIPGFMAPLAVMLHVLALRAATSSTNLKGLNTSRSTA